MRKNIFWAASFLLLSLAGMTLFMGCNNAIAPTSASDPNYNSLIPQPPETALTTNVAFTGIAMNGDNAFAFVALQPLSASTTIYFTDGGWDANTTSLIGGHAIAFIPAKTLPPGTQVLIAETQAGASIISNDNVTGVAGAISTDGVPGDGMGLSKSGSDLIAYMVPSAGSTQFLTALNNNPNHPFLSSGSASKANTYVPPGLKVGVTAIDLYKLQGENDVFGNCGVFQFPAQVNSTQFLAILINPANWVVAPGGSSTVALPGTGVKMCDFTAVFNPIPTAVSTPWTGPSPTNTPLPCGYPGPTCTPTITSTPGAIAPGTIAFTGLTFNGNSQFSFASTTNLAAGQVIYFTNYSYDTTVPGLVDGSTSCCNDGTNGITVVEGILSYTAGSSGLSPYNQVVIGNTGNETNILQGGAVASLVGNGGNNWLVLNHNGSGHKLLAYATTGANSTGVTTWLGGVIFGPDSWYQNTVNNGSAIPTSGQTIPGQSATGPAFWDSYLPTGLDSTTSTDLHGLWSASLITDEGVDLENDNAVLDSCQNTLAGIVNPAHWVADGNQSKTHVNLSPVIGLTGACSAGSGGYTGSLP